MEALALSMTVDMGPLLWMGDSFLPSGQIFTFNQHEAHIKKGRMISRTEK